ncbi:hypothetical protein NESM_000098200 [Novymonas esmeraldas]|uniref:DRBM domain-containing protein n=1 Tax=Novymonas esmeraldas TaxID=1808958 RepID=A0AAW0F203_9TRYP
MMRFSAGVAGWRLCRRACATAHVASSTAATTQRRCCSSLGHIRAVLQAVRAAGRVHGGTVRLCIDEDLRVAVEHEAASDGSEPPLLREVASWQGTAAATVREAVGHLHSLDSTTAIASAAPPPPPPLPAVPTIVDIRREGTGEVRRIAQMLEQRHPQLRLAVQHTSGRDLQGSTVHTFSVGLQPRGIGTAVTSLSAEQQQLAKDFKGESAGEKYMSTLRWALRDAFAAANLVYPSSSVSDPLAAAPAASVLSLYTAAWSPDGFLLQLSPTPGAEGHLLCTLSHGTTGRALRSTALTLDSDGLRAMLIFCEETVAEHYPDAHAAVQRRLREAPLHLILPRHRLQVKVLLRRLLLYHYGIGEDEVIFRAETNHGGLFCVQVQVRLASLNIASSAVECFVLGKATSSSKSTAAGLAAVRAVQRIFPDIYERDIAYHPEVRAILGTGDAATSDTVAPPVARGLDAQLRWALEREGATFTLEYTHLKPNTVHTEWCVQTGQQPAWLAQLFIERRVNGTGAAASRELCSHAFDSRKARSEQKAIAAALSRRFPVLCRASVNHAHEKKLIDDSGAPTSCGSVSAVQDGNAATGALASDPFLCTLNVHELATPQRLPPVPTADSVLERCWGATTRLDTFIGSIRVARDASRAAYEARCTTASTTPGAADRILATATAPSEISALLSLLRSLRELPEVVDPSAADSSAADELAALTTIAPALPDAAPLQACVEAIARLYGLECSVSVRQEGLTHRAELLGVVPADSALTQPHPRLTANPFMSGRVFFLGRGRASTPLMSIVHAAQYVFNTHVRVHQSPFRDDVVSAGQFRLHLREEAALHQLRTVVVDEIASSSDRAVSDSWLLFSLDAPHRCDLSLRVASGKCVVVLEQVVSTSLLACARELCRHVSVETGVCFLSPQRCASIVWHTAEQLLRQLCLQAYGLDMRTDVCESAAVWHSRVSVRITDEIAYCIASASSARKKDAIEAAALAALQEYFADQLPYVSDYSTLSVTKFVEGARSGGADASSSSSSSLGSPAEAAVVHRVYAFRLSESPTAADSR